MQPENLTQEQLKSLTPEQLAALQKQNCIFCHIASGKVQSKKIFEDENFVAVLDINPCNPGHVLLFTKEHYSIMPQIPKDILEKMALACKRLSNAALKVLQAGGTTIFAANGMAAGQKAPHFMVHIIPRKENDGISGFDFDKKDVDADTVTAKITAKLSGKPEEDKKEKESDPGLDLDTIAKLIQ